jgi:hypothetical protein
LYFGDQIIVSPVWNAFIGYLSSEAEGCKQSV